MDRNEAIEHLKVVLKTCDVQDEEAVEMAIEALEQAETNCSEIPNNCPAADVVPVVRCDDCVYYGSRRWCELVELLYVTGVIVVGEMRNQMTGCIVWTALWHGCLIMCQNHIRKESRNDTD